MIAHFIRTIITIWQREIIRYGREKSRIISTLVQPLMFLAIFGAGLRQTIAGGNFGVDYVQFMYPGIIAMATMGVSFFSTISTVWDREFGFLKEILVAPVSRTAIALGKTLGAATIASLQALLLLFLAPFLSLALDLSLVAKLVVFMLVLSFAISSIGLLIASLMKTTESFGLIMQLLVFPMFFLSGAFFPLTAVPAWLAWLAKINPLTYGVDAMRQIILAGQVQEQILNKIILYPLSIDLLFLLIFSAVMLILATVAFNKTE